MSEINSCPECDLQLDRYPQGDIAGDFKRYKCSNGHMVAVNTKTKKVASIILPFTPPTSCPECGSTQLKTDFDRSFTEGNNMIRFARYICSKGHRFDKRQPILKRFNGGSA